MGGGAEAVSVSQRQQLIHVSDQCHTPTAVRLIRPHSTNGTADWVKRRGGAEHFEKTNCLSILYNSAV